MTRPTKRLGKICSFQNGFAFQSNLFKEEGEPILRISNIQNDKISDENLVFFNLSDYEKNLDNYIVYPGDLVIAMSGATTGKLAINDTDRNYYLNQRVGKFIFKHEITKRRCHLFLSTKIKENLQQSSGSAIPNLSTEQIKSIQIPLPDLSTQKAIVAKLDTTFSSLDQAITLEQKNLNHLDKLKKSILNETFNLNKGYIYIKCKGVTISDIAIQIQYGYTGKTKEKGKFKYLRITDIQNNNVKWENVPFSGITYEEAKKYLLNEGDLIFARTGATVGKSFLMNEEGAGSIFASYLIRIIPDKKQVSSKFLSYFFQCEIYRNQIYEDVVGAAQPNFNGTKLSKIQIPLPSLEHQQKIVAHLDETFSHLNQLKSAYEQKLTRLQELKASILAESFFK